MDSLTRRRLTQSIMAAPLVLAGTRFAAAQAK